MLLVQKLMKACFRWKYGCWAKTKRAFKRFKNYVWGSRFFTSSVSVPENSEIV